MNVHVELIPEPDLEFYGHFVYPDKKTGLSEHGPYGRTDPALHKDQIRVGIVGTRATVELAQRWIDECRSPIETNKTIKRDMPEDHPEGEDHVVEALVKSLTPDFVGFNPEGPFASTVLTADRWRSYIQDREVRLVAELEDDVARVERATDLIADHIQRLATVAPHPDIILVALPDLLVKKAASAQLKDGSWLNLRRGLKARSMTWGVPIQLVQEGTLTGKRAGLQDQASRAWNFSTALYFKAGGVPWRGHGLAPDDCFIGITFYTSEDTSGNPILRSGVAQAFDYLGQGVVLRGEPFEWDEDENGRTPHLTREGARRLIARTLAEYEKIRGLPPRRVVVHKSSRFWGESRGKFNEVEGFFEGIADVNPRATADLVTLARSSVRLARVGQYPPIRGTFAQIEGGRPILYTHGFTPYFETYPGVHVPEPWTILENHGDSGVRELAAELLALTKMNVNNAAFSDGIPITLAFSRRVSDVLKQVGPEMTVRSEYAFYM